MSADAKACIGGELLDAGDALLRSSVLISAGDFLRLKMAGADDACAEGAVAI